MITTTLRNNTNSIVVLREGQVGVLRKVCDIQPGDCHQVRSNLTATYKEYWCAVQPSNGNDKFILTSDDCIDWKEIEIRPTDNDPTKFEWKGRIPAKANPQNANPGTAPAPGSPSSPSAPPSTFSSKLRSIKWLANFFFKPKLPAPGSPPAASRP